MSDLIEKRDERTRRRKKVKRKMDSIIGLSFHDKDKKVLSVSVEAQKLADNTARLIDEGYIDNGFVIKKGTLEKYLNGQNQYVRGWEFDGEEWVQTEVLNLTSDFVGNVNLGHLDFARFPYDLGWWKQNDLSLVEIENDRQALDVQLHLDEESVFIKELKRQPFDIGISAEFWVHENVEDTNALSEMLGYYLPVYDEIFIFAYGLVGECGNVNSSGLELKGEPMKDEKNLIETEVKENLEEEKEELGVEEIDITATEEEQTTEETSEVEEVANETAEAEEEDADIEEAEENEEDGEEVDDDEADNSDEVEDDEAEEENDALDQALARVKDLTEQVQNLTSQVSDLTEANAKLKKANRRMEKKYQSELDKKARFMEELKGVSVELLPDEDKKEEEEELKVTKRSRNGIGEI